MVLILILSGMMVGYLTFILISGILNSQMEISSGASWYNNVSIVFDDGDNNEAAISAFLNDEPLGELYNALIIDTGDNGPNVIGWKGTDFTRWHALDAGCSFFTSGQSESDQNIAIISDGYAGLGKETFGLDGNDYKIIGQYLLSFPMFVREIPVEINYKTDEYGHSDTVIIPYRTFIKNGFTADILRLDLKKSIHSNETLNMETLQSYFKNQEIYFSDSVYEDDTETNRVALIRFIFTGLCILALVSIFSLFNYWIRLNKKQYLIYEICGASNLTIFALIALEWLIINIISFALGFCISLIIKIPLSYLDLSLEISAAECILLLAAGFALSFMFSIGTVLRVSNKMNRFDLRGDVS